MGSLAVDALTWLWVPVVGWMLLGLPWYEERLKRRRERERRDFEREWDHAMVVSEHGKAGLEQRLVDDLRKVLLMRALRESDYDIDLALDIYNKSKGR